MGEAVAAAGEAELLGPWGHGTPEDEARARANGELSGGAPGEAAGATEKGTQEAVEVEVPTEPEAGDGVRRVLERMYLHQSVYVIMMVFELLFEVTHGFSKLV